MNSPVLDVARLSTAIAGSTGTVRAVEDVTFAIFPGETVALLGESGCGKSMTALSIMRLLPEAGRITAGSVHFRGQDILALTEAQMRQIRGGAIAMIFQEPATSLNPVLTVGQQIAEVLARHAGVSGAQLRRRALQLLADVGIPDPQQRVGDYPFRLSGGMNQRVMMAIALAGEPQLLIADEPTTALDVTIQAQVLDLLERLQCQRRMAVLLITHDLGIVARLAHRVAVMYAGEIIEIAPRDGFLAAPRHPYSGKLFAALPSAARRDGRLETIAGTVPPLTSRFAGCRFAERCPAAWDLCRTKPPAWHHVADRHEVRCHLFDPAVPRRVVADGNRIESRVASSIRQREDVLLDVADLRVHFPVRRGVLKRTVGHVKAVDGVSLRLPAGQTLALVGESGCGKTTTGKAIVQLIRPTAGTVRFQGTELSGLRERQLRPLRRAMQIVFQNPFASLDPRMRVGQIIEEGLIALSAAEARSARQARLAALLARVGLSADMLGRYPHEFSGGQRQRIAIARALAVEPDLIVCDEPTSALDVSVQAQILNLLKELQQSLGLSFLFITHNIAVVEYLAHQVAVMYLGRVVEQGLADEILRRPCHPYTEALLSAVPRLERSRPPPIFLSGEIPSSYSPPRGCHFHPRCPKAKDICRQIYPDTKRLSASHEVSCHLYG